MSVVDWFWLLFFRFVYWCVFCSGLWFVIWLIRFCGCLVGLFISGCWLVWLVFDEYLPYRFGDVGYLIVYLFLRCLDVSWVLRSVVLWFVDWFCFGLLLDCDWDFAGDWYWLIVLYDSLAIVADSLFYCLFVFMLFALLTCGVVCFNLCLIISLLLWLVYFVIWFVSFIWFKFNLRWLLCVVGCFEFVIWWFGWFCVLNCMFDLWCWFVWCCGCSVWFWIVTLNWRLMVLVVCFVILVILFSFG